jgi:hypothetical protein
MSPTYDDIRKLIERRFRRRMFFSFHAIFFMAAVIVTGWWILTHEVYYGDWQNLWYLAGWAVIFFLHALLYRLSNARDREIEAIWSGVYGVVSPEKQKFGLEEDRYVHLFEDGEWIGDIEATERPKRRG